MHLAITRRAPLDTPDGINISIFALGDALVAAGHRVSYVCATESDPDELRRLYGINFDPEVVALSRNRGWDGNYRRLITPWIRHGRQAIARLKPDYTIINGALPFPLPGGSCVVSHDLERRMASLGATRRLYKRITYGFASDIVATCTEIRDLLAEELKRPPSRIRVIPTCFDLSGYAGRPLAEREPTILHMGTVDYKNPRATLAAFAALETPARLVVTGKVDDELRATIDALPDGVRERIALPGFVDAAELRDLLGRVRVVSVPSVYSVPVASPSVIEPFASATPVVAGDSISRDVLEDGVNGAVVRGAEPMGIARRLDELLTDDALWSRFSTAALERSRTFGAEAVARRYVDLAVARRRRHDRG
jgi:glycosyltransferase involved in cell wall biosynthesis